MGKGKGHNKMKIDVYSNMYNEETILPYWLRHYETIADRIFVWDDYSTDDTKEILKKHPKVTLLDIGKKNSEAGYWARELFPQYEKYSIGSADWVVLADADEFVYAPNLQEILEKEKEKGTHVIRCTGYAMVSKGLPTTDGQIYEEIKNGLVHGLESKWAIHATVPGVRYARGKHGPVHNQRRFVRNRNAGIKLLHYRYLGEAYQDKQDRRNLARTAIAFGREMKYSRNLMHTCPDGTRGSILDWYALHKKEAKNVID